MKNTLSIILLALAGTTMSSIAIATGSSYKPQPLGHSHLKYKSLNYGRSYSSRPSSSYSRPSSFPGQGSSHMNATASSKTVGKLPSFNNFPPSGSSNPRPVGVSASSIGSGIPSSVSTGKPSSLPPPLPSAASAGRVPSSVPPVSAGSGRPASMPSMPGAASTRIPDAAAAGLANRGGGRP